jgi:hypothetical protein
MWYVLLCSQIGPNVLNIWLPSNHLLLALLLKLYRPHHTKDARLIALAPRNLLFLFRVYQLLGESGTYYGVRFGKKIPWVTEFPFGYIKDPQYVGSMLSLVALLCWVPLQYVLLWCLGYVFMMWVEQKEDPATRAKPLS